MADDERLREALLELQLLRQREAQTLEATRTLAECLEAYSTAPDVDGALSALFDAMCNKLGLALICVAKSIEGDVAEVESSSDPALVGQAFQPPFALFVRARNIANLERLGAWGGPRALWDHRSLLVCPVREGITVLGFGDGTERIGKQEVNLFKRLASLAVQATNNVQLAQEKELLSAAIAGSSSGIAIADAKSADLPLVYVNRAFEELSGYSSSEVLGENCRFLSAEPSDAPERSRLREAVAERKRGSFLLLNQRKNGDMFWNELSLFPVRSADGSVRNLVATQTDVSERIAASEERDRERARMEQAFAATEDAFLVLEHDGTVALSNYAVLELFHAPKHFWRPGTRFQDNWENYIESAEDLPGRTTALLRNADLRALADVPSGQELDLPDGRSVLVRAANLEDGGLVITATDISPMKSAQNLLAQRLAAIEVAPDGIAVSDTDGRLVYLNSAAGRLMGYKRATSGLGRIWWHQYSNRKALSDITPFEPTLAQLEDADSSTHEITSSPLDSGGHIILIRDVTEKLATEAREEELMRDMIRLQRQEAIAQITAGVAHDFNNYLAAINGSATLIDMKPDLAPDIRDHVERIQAAGTQSARLVNRLLDIGAGQDDDSRFGLTSALLDVPKLVEPMFGPGITFAMDLSDHDLVLSGDPGELTQVLINLILNGRDAIEVETGEVRLRTHAFQTDTARDVAVGTLSANTPYAAISIVDTGKGMDPETMSKIFQPYFTTKGQHGTGLGMAMVAAQMSSVNGAIGLSSEPGVGTEICLYWPLANSDAQDDQPEASGTYDLSGQTILVVDDDEQVGEVIARFLEAQGAEVAHCTDPRDAAEALEDDPQAWSALVSDYDMPGMNGGQLANHARSHNSDLKILVVTALARRLNDPRLSNAKVAAILPKPVNLKRLSAELAETGDAEDEEA